jgi:hypothetical protein
MKRRNLSFGSHQIIGEAIDTGSMPGLGTVSDLKLLLKPEVALHQLFEIHRRVPVCCSAVFWTFWS